MSTPLASWNEGTAKDAILDFVRRSTADDSAEAVPPEDRVAVFDNDGTLWCEKPMPIQLDFILRRLVAMTEDDPDLRTAEPWRAASERDYAWLASVLSDHYAGDDTKLAGMAAGILKAHADISVDRFDELAAEFLRTARHPTLDRSYLDCAYAPMIDLLGYLRANGFATYIASGGGRDFMRPITADVYGIPRENVIGSATALEYTADDDGGTIVRRAEADYLDDGPEKPVRIWDRTGRRPILAAGNSNGDIEMLEFTRRSGRPSLQLLVLHDDAEREFDYTSGSERALERARDEGWTVVSIRNDWNTVF